MTDAVYSESGYYESLIKSRNKMLVALNNLFYNFKFDFLNPLISGRISS